MDALRRKGEPVLLVDAGDAVAAKGGQIPNEAVLAAMAAGGCAALNVGDEEAAWGLANLRKAAAEARLPLVSSNLLERATGGLAFAPELSLEVAGVRVAILGVVAPGWEAGQRPLPATEFTTADPAWALARRVPRLRRSHDLIVVLAQLSRDQAGALARKVPGIDVIVGGEDRIQAPRSGPLAATFWLQAKPYGKGLVMARVAAGSAGSKVLGWREIPFPEKGPANARVAQIIAEAEKPPLAAPNPLAMGYRGASGCQPCHGSEFAAWASTPHATAYETLRKERRAADPSCLACHATNAPGQPGSATLPGVQCEACHGPYSEHDARYVKGGKKAAQTDWKPVCLRCHDPANSPKFDLDTYLPKVRHRRPAPAGSAPAPTETDR